MIPADDPTADGRDAAPASAAGAASDERLLADLDSTEERVRAAAAAALFERGHPRALEASLRTLDDAEEEAHADITPSVWRLAAFGAAALDGLFDRMVDAAPMTRLHAGRAAREIGKRQFGFDGRDWPDGAYARWAAWWQQDIGYVADGPPEQRAAAVARLRAARAGWPQEPSGRP